MDGIESLTYIVGFGIFAIVVLAGVLYVSSLPPSKKKKKKFKSDKTKDVEESKDWEGLLARREKYIHTLKNEVAKLLREQKERDRLVESAKEQIKKLKEKLRMEHQWREKETSSVDKNAQKLKQLKDDLMKIEQDFEKEHSQNLRMQRDLEGLTKEMDSLAKLKKDQDLEVARLNTLAAQLKRDLTEQQKLNAELSKKKDDTEWIAKSDYEKLEKLLQEKEKDLERLSRQQESH